MGTVYTSPKIVPKSTKSSLKNNLFNALLGSNILTSLNKKEIKFSLLNEKFKQFEFFNNQSSIYSGDREEKLKQLDSNLITSNSHAEEFYTKYRLILNITKMNKEKALIEEKINNYEMTIEFIKKMINQKQINLNYSTSIFCLNKEQYNEKFKDIEKKYNSIEKLKLIKNTIKNKKLIEVTHFFFNKMCFQFYIIPPFALQVFDNNNKQQRFQFYTSNCKEINLMTGSIANLANYLSKVFNIPLKYPQYLNGSNSYIIKSKKEE
jgi:hypothetical protein